MKRKKAIVTTICLSVLFAPLASFGAKTVPTGMEDKKPEQASQENIQQNQTQDKNQGMRR